PRTSSTGSVTSATPEASAIWSGNGNGYSPPNQWILYSPSNKARAPNDSVNQPSHLVSPEAQNGIASVTRSTSSVSERGHRPNSPAVIREKGCAKRSATSDMAGSRRGAEFQANAENAPASMRPTRCAPGSPPAASSGAAASPSGAPSRSAASRSRPPGGS